MVANAINNSANIFLTGGAQYQQANRNIFDAITAAADMYDRMQLQKQASLDAMRQKEAERQAEAAKEAMKPENILAKAIQMGPETLSPQERAQFEASQQIAGAKMGLDQYNRPVSTYNPIDLNSIGGRSPVTPFSPTGTVPTPSPVADVMFPNVREELLPAPAGGVLPPRTDGKAGTAAQFNSDMTAPPPLGTPAPKVDAPKFEAPKSSNPMAATDPGKMEAWKKELELAAKRAEFDWQKEKDFEIDQKQRTNIQYALDRMKVLNDEINKAGGFVNDQSNIAQRAGAMVRGAKIPLPFRGDVKIGAAGEKLLDPSVAKKRAEFDTLRSMLFPFYAKASGLSATAIDTEQARQDIMKSIGDPNGIYETNKQQLETVSALLGTGSKSQTTTVDETDPAVKRALEAGYTKEQIKAYLDGRK